MYEAKSRLCVYIHFNDFRSRMYGAPRTAGDATGTT